MAQSRSNHLEHGNARALHTRLAELAAQAQAAAIELRIAGCSDGLHVALERLEKLMLDTDHESVTYRKNPPSGYQSATEWMRRRQEQGREKYIRAILREEKINRGPYDRKEGRKASSGGGRVQGDDGEAKARKIPRGPKA